MIVLLGMKNLSSGVFISRIEKSREFESRKDRQRRVNSERQKQWNKSFMANGAEYRKQKGWVLWVT